MVIGRRDSFSSHGHCNWLGTCSTSSLSYAFIPFNFVTYNAAQIGSGMESILLAFALADRVNLLKREKEEKQLQYTLELEER